MNLFRYYIGRSGSPGTLAETESKLSSRLKLSHNAHKDYIPDSGLVAAANVAIHLGQPLLLTGEPGCGKTEFAYHLAWSLGFDKALRFETKSTTAARDLFYYYDTLGRLHDAQGQVRDKGPLDYITFNALGIAILRACQHLQQKYVVETCRTRLKDLDEPRQRSIVLIDEIDKAPRDFPNDLLTELEEVYFRISEVPALASLRIEADPQLTPIVVITSNSERNLPDAFLRRCIFYNIPFPTDTHLRDIIAARLETAIAAPQFLEDALGLFKLVRETADMKRPSVAELLNWLQILRCLEPDSNKNPLDLDSPTIVSTMAVLLKGSDRESLNLDQISALVNSWQQKKAKSRQPK